MVDSSSGAPVLLERVRDGQMVALLLLDAPPVWWEPPALALVDLAAFGLDPAASASAQEVGDVAV
jgi:DUF917 family protein